MEKSADETPAPRSAPPAVIAVRILGLFLAAIGLWQALGNVLASWRDFDPSYLSYYFSMQLARPCAGIAVGLCLWLFARPIGRRAMKASRRD